MALSILLLPLLLLGVMASSQGKQTISQFNSSIGSVIDYTSRAGKQEKLAVEMAVEDFFLSTGHKSLLYVKDSEGSPVKAAWAATELIHEKKVQAIVGLRTWKETAFVAELGATLQIPVVSFAANAPPLLTHERWPFLLRMACNSKPQMKAVAAIVETYQWRIVTIIYEDNNYGTAGSMASLIGALRDVSADVDYQSVFPPFASLTNPTALIQQELQKLKKKHCRVFIVHTSLYLSTLLFEEAKLMGMMEKDYVWIATEAVMNHLDFLNASVASSMQGVLGPKTYYPHTLTRFRDFSVQFRRRFRLKYPEEDDAEPGIVPLRAYDAVWAVLKAIESLHTPENQKLDSQPPWENSTKPTNLGLLYDGILSSNFQGLSGRIQFLGTELVPAPVLQIANVVGRSYRELGFWSSNWGFFRTVDDRDMNMNMSMSSRSMKILRHVTWPGDSPHVPRGWATSDKPLQILVPANSSYEKIMSVKYNEATNKWEFKGFTIDVFKMVLDHLPYDLRYEFIPFNGTYDALVEKLQLKEKTFDAAVGDTAIVGNRCRYGEFSQPYSESGVRMMVLEKPKAGKAWIFVKPFTKELWASTAAIIIFNGLVVFFIERNGDNKATIQGSITNQIGVLIRLSFNTIFFMQEERFHSNLSWMAMVVWLLVGFVLTSSYTASLSSMLTVQRLEPSVVNVEYLKETKAMVGCDHTSFVVKFLEEVLLFDRNCIKPFNTGDDYPEALRSGEIKAAFLEVPYIKYLLAKNCKGFTATGPTYEIGGFGFAFSKGSSLAADFSQVIVELREKGKLRDLEKDLLSSFKCSTSNDSDDDDVENGSLSLDSFWVLFAITVATTTFAFLLFLLGRCRDRNYLDPVRFEGMRIHGLLMALGKHLNRGARVMPMQGI